MTEFRKYGRSPLPGTVRLKHREIGEIYVEDGDISATGLFLKFHRTAEVAVGDELAAELVDAADSGSAGETRLRVVRVTGEGIGVAFI